MTWYPDDRKLVLSSGLAMGRTIYGIEHAMYGEIVIFENGIRGMVQDIRRDQIGCIILGKDTEIKEGTKVTRTGRKKQVFR